MCIFAYGIPTDYADEYLRIGEDTMMKSAHRFCKVMMRMYVPMYLRTPNHEDTARLMVENEQRGWADMLGSIDGMHWTRKFCPKAWQGLYYGRSKEPTIVLEAVASHDLWIWHSFFLVFRVLSMISMFCIDPIFLPG
jgi:hypothetical protein